MFFCLWVIVATTQTHPDRWMSVQRCVCRRSGEQNGAVLCDAGCRDINNNTFIPPHPAKHEVRARPVHDISNTTAIGQDWSGMSTISLKLNTPKETRVNNTFSPGLRLRPRFSSGRQTSEILHLKLKGYLASSYMEGSRYLTSWLDFTKYFHVSSEWIYFILWQILRERGKRRERRSHSVIC